MKKTIIAIIIVASVLVAGLIAYAYRENNNWSTEHEWTGICCEEARRGMHGIGNKNINPRISNNNRQIVTITGTIVDIDYDGWINVVTENQAYHVVVKGLWENNTNDKISFTELLANLNINTTITITGYLGEHGYSIGAQVIEYNNTTYIRPCLSE